MPFDYTNRQLKRVYELIIGDPDNNKGLRIIGNEDEDEGLEIGFSIEKNLDNKENSNNSTIDITNLSEDSIEYIQKDSLAIILKVGYRGTTLNTLFQGLISEVDTKSRDSRQDRVTSLKCVPADNLTYQSNISKTFPPDTTPRQIITYLVGQSQTITRASFNSDNIDNPFPFGYSIEGSVKSVLNELARDFDFTYRIDGKRLSISDNNKYQSPNSAQKAVKLTPTTGLLGVPTYSTDDGKKVDNAADKKKGVKFRALINPLIQPGSAVSLEGSAIEGIFRVNSAKYTGNWRGNRWEVECFCSKLSGREVNNG